MLKSKPRTSESNVVSWKRGRSNEHNWPAFKRQHDLQWSSLPELAEMLGHLVHWSGVRFKANGVTNHFQNNYVHLENDMEKNIIKLFYKFPTNEKMRAGMGSVEYPPQSRQRNRGTNQWRWWGWLQLWTQSEGRLNIKKNTTAQLGSKTKQEQMKKTDLPLKIICKHNTKKRKTHTTTKD